jgi:hypothetical protein
VLLEVEAAAELELPEPEPVAAAAELSDFDVELSLEDVASFVELSLDEESDDAPFDSEALSDFALPEPLSVASRDFFSAPLFA